MPLQMLQRQSCLRPSAADLLLKVSQRGESSDGDEDEMDDLSDIGSLVRENKALKQQLADLRRKSSSS